MIVTVVGARPQFVKAAVVSRAMQEAGIEERIVHTGQHYDAQMSEVFWQELGIPPIHVNLGVGSERPGRQLARMMERLEDYILSADDGAQAIMVYGDTNSTLAGALVAAHHRLPVFHVEAGLRSYNRAMPEEINRVATDHLAELCFCPSAAAVEALAREGISDGVFDVGDVMYDALLTFVEAARRSHPLSQVLPFEVQPYLVMTVHRQANTDDPMSIHGILEGVGALELPVIWPVHPRMSSAVASLRLPSNIHPTPPLSYFAMLSLLDGATAVVTDSGGLQKEAYWLRKPCITVRQETEWVETTTGGWNRVVGTEAGGIVSAFRAGPTETWAPLYGDGHASERIAALVAEHLGS